MSNFPWDQTFVGWIHITSAAAVVGFFFVWLLALQGADGGAARSVVARYRPFFWVAALLLPLTGVYTWYIRAGQSYPAFYFHVIYTKILLYVILFGIAGILTKRVRAPGAAGERSGLLAACAVLCLVILFLSAFMRRVTPAPPSAAEQAYAAPGTSIRMPVVIRKGVAPKWQS